VAEQTLFLTQQQLWFSDFALSRQEQAARAVRTIAPDRLLYDDPEMLFAEFQRKYGLQPLELHENQQQATEPRSVSIPLESLPDSHLRLAMYVPGLSRRTVDGFEVVVRTPFTGTPDLWSTCPSSYTYNPPRGRIAGASLEFIFQCETQPNWETIRAETSQRLVHVKQWLKNLNPEVEQANQRLDQVVRRGIDEARKVQVDAIEGRQRAGFGAVELRRIVPKLTAGEPAFQLPVQPLAQADLPATIFHTLLELMYRFGRQLERHPVRAVLGEEDLRATYLMSLNAIVFGGASGETFRHNGKTDILVRIGEEDMLLAECKIWGGDKTLQETIRQLLGYLTWRHEAAAIVFFNHNRDHVAVLETIKQGLGARDDVQSAALDLAQSRVVCSLTHPLRHDRSLALTVLAVHLPKA
jgi:hypothetical protein